MDTSLLSSVPVGYETNWGDGTWLIVLGLLFVALLIAGVAAIFLYLAKDHGLDSEGAGMLVMAGRCYLVAWPGSAILVWIIARHLPTWGWTLAFYGIFIAAAAFFSVGMIAVWHERIDVQNQVGGRAMAYSAGLSTLVATGIAFAVFVGDGAARSGIMREVPERIATGAGLILYVAIAFFLVPFGTRLYLKANG